MKTIVKVLLTSLIITGMGAILICIKATATAGMVALIVGTIGMLFTPLISSAIEES